MDRFRTRSGLLLKSVWRFSGVLANFVSNSTTPLVTLHAFLSFETCGRIAGATRVAGVRRGKVTIAAGVASVEKPTPEYGPKIFLG